jgi:hypothetical protein
MIPEDPRVARMREALVAGANPGGGWGYYSGHASRLEPTCWALLALTGYEPAESPPGPKGPGLPGPKGPGLPGPKGPGVQEHRDFFRHSQASDGLLMEPAVREEGRPNLAFNGLAALLLAARPELADDAFLSKLLDAIIAHKGVKLSQWDLTPQDNSLQAWPWIDSTFSWVEPTCFCLLALKKRRERRDGQEGSARGPREESESSSAAARARGGGAPRAVINAVREGKTDVARPFQGRERIEEAERLLRDRACPDGGWNFGSGTVMGQGLYPFVPTTALGLIALQDLPSDPIVIRSAALLKRHRLAERSAMALSLTLIAFAIHGEDTLELRDALLAQWDRTEFLGNFHLTALALYGLTGQHDGFAPFRV